MAGSSVGRVGFTLWMLWDEGGGGKEACDEGGEEGIDVELGYYRLLATYYHLKAHKASYRCV